MKRKEVKLGGAAAVQAVPDTDDEDLREGPSPKSRKGEMSGAGVTLEALQAMMEAQTRTLMNASQQHLDVALGRLEHTMDSKINGLDDRVDRMVAASEQAEERIAKLESQLAELVSHGVPPGPPGLGGRRPGGEERRLRTLVYGGWARESRRKVILEELQEAVASLGVADLLDDSPFTTGARRSMALSSFNQRPGESFENMRSRMPVCTASSGRSLRPM